MTGSTGCRCWCIHVPSRYDLTQPVLSGERLLTCNDCGTVVADGGVVAHDGFHRRVDPGRHSALAYCTCDHLEPSHDLNAKGVRTACFHIDGPRGTHCPCKVFTERSGHAG
jgi:hypothetical protein